MSNVEQTWPGEPFSFGSMQNPDTSKTLEPSAVWLLATGDRRQQADTISIKAQAHMNDHEIPYLWHTSDEAVSSELTSA